MAKVLTRFASSGLLSSHLGVRGASELPKPPVATSVAAVLEAFDGLLTMTACTQGDDLCDQFSKCNVRDPLRRVRDRIAAIMAECGIAELAADRDPVGAAVTPMSSPVVRRAPTLSAASRES